MPEDQIAAARAAIAEVRSSKDEDISIQEMLAEGSFGKVNKGCARHAKALCQACVGACVAHGCLPCALLLGQGGVWERCRRALPWNTKGNVFVGSPEYKE